MQIHPDMAAFLVILLTGVLSSGIGFAIGSARKRRQLARAEERMAGDTGERFDAVLREVQDLRAHIADLTLMMDDSRGPEKRALSGDE